MSNGTSTSIVRLILDEAKELRRKQDSRLTSLLAFSSAVLAGFLTVSTIAVAAAGTAAGSLVVVVVLIALALVLMTAAAQRESRNWLEGPDIGYLVRSYHGTKVPPGALELDLVHTLEAHRMGNENVLRKIRWWLVLQVIVASAGAMLLLLAVAFPADAVAA